MANYISGREIINYYGLRPFQLMQYCRDGLIQPYDDLSGRPIRDPKLNPLPLPPYTDDQRLMIQLREAPYDPYEPASEKNERISKILSLERKGVELPSITRMEQLPEYKDYIWQTFSVDNTTPCWEYEFVVDDVKELAKKEGLYRRGMPHPLLDDGHYTQEINETDGDTLAYMNEKHPFFSRELKIAVQAWVALYEENPPSGTPKGGHLNYIERWLRENHPGLGTTAIKRIKTIVNPNKSGGASPSEEF